jgi:Cellulase N-terminal ig-like domain
VGRVASRGTAAATAAVALCAGVVGVVMGDRSPASGSAAGEGHVRVNQVGYPRAADERAYLMASAPATGAPFTVTDSGGRAVASGQVRPSRRAQAAVAAV